MRADFSDIIDNIARAYSFLRCDEAVRCDLLKSAGAALLEAGPNREGDLEAKLTFPDGKTLTIIVLLREITDASTEGVPDLLRALFKKRLRESLPVVR